jgi:hypothetical protein
MSPALPQTYRHPFRGRRGLFIPLTACHICPHDGVRVVYEDASGGVHQPASISFDARHGGYWVVLQERGSGTIELRGVRERHGSHGEAVVSLVEAQG